MRRRRWLRPAAAVLVAMALGTALWHPWTDPASTPEPTAVTAVERAPDVQQFTAHGPGGSTVTVYRSISRSTAAVAAQHLPGAPAGRVYQLWLEDSTGVLRPAGFLTGGTSSSATLRGDAATAQGAAITVEPAGGSPTPTSTPVAFVRFSA
jgi:anti-sigma-K factor RskA